MADPQTLPGTDIPAPLTLQQATERAAAVPHAPLTGDGPTDFAQELDRSVRLGVVSVEQAAHLAAQNGLPADYRSLLDDRRPDQTAHDNFFGMRDNPDAEDYRHGLADASPTAAANDGAFRELVANLNMPREGGIAFINAVRQAAAELDRCRSRDEVAALTAQWDRQSAAVWGDRAAEADRQVADLAAMTDTGEILKAMGALAKAPMVRAYLANHAARVSLWRNTRPA